MCDNNEKDNEKLSAKSEEFLYSEESIKHKTLMNTIKITQISTLIISGGCMKGGIYVGALILLDEYKILQKIKNYYGTSIGAILISCLALGWNLDEIAKLFINYPVGDFIRSDIEILMSEYGLISSSDYETLYKKIITFKGHDPNITFGELYEKTSKNLNMNTYSIKTNKQIILNHNTFPNLMLWQGMYMTSALPILVPPVEFNDDFYIDGGIIGNFIIEQIPEKSNETIAISSFSHQTNWLEVCDKIRNKNIFNYLSYTFELIKIAFIKHTQKNPKQHILLKIDELDNEQNNEQKNIQTNKQSSLILPKGFNFFMDENTKQQMINVGYNQTKNQIHTIITHLFNLQLDEIKQNSQKFKSKYNEI
jgi:hypothetical protein